MITTSPWLANAQETGWPALTRDIDCDVAVVGAGIVGVSAAHRLAETGASVVVLEAGTVAGGVTGHSSAKLSALQGVAYSTIRRLGGAEAAAQYARLNRDGLSMVRSVARQHEIECSLVERPAVSFAETGEGAEDLAGELEAARAAGLAVHLEGESDLPFPVSAALTLPGQTQFDPVAWTRAVAGLLPRAGGEIFEHSRVTAMNGFGRRELILENGSVVRADRVVLATHIPVFDRGGYFARVEPMTSFAVAGPVPGPVPEGMYLSVDGPVRSIRPLVPDEAGETSLLVGGEGHRPGTGSASASFGRLREYMRTRFDGEPAGFEWGAHDQMSFDRLPLIGKLLPFSDRVFVATGFSKWGLAAGAGASKVLADHLNGGSTEAMAAFDPARIRPRAARSFLAHNLDSGARLIVDRIRKRSGPVDLLPGEGRVVGSGLGQKAICRDRDGEYHEVSARCTHLGCIVAWNDGEMTWDCPCHGSRFRPDGSVIQGPAVSPLKPPGGGA